MCHGTSTPIVEKKCEISFKGGRKEEGKVEKKGKGRSNPLREDPTMGCEDFEGLPTARTSGRRRMIADRAIIAAPYPSHRGTSTCPSD